MPARRNELIRFTRLAKVKTSGATLVCFALIVSVFPGCARKPQSTTSELSVAAASDLIPAFEELGRQFEASYKIKVTFTFGSSGMLTRQIENGAPVDVFAAASVNFIEQLEKKGRIIPDTKVIFARGRIALWTPRDSSLKIEKLTDLTDAEVKRIAIANPDHAPYGMAAREALESAGIWDKVNSKLVYADNIRQTLQFAETGNVEVAIVALSLTQASDGHWVLIPEELHKPIDQAIGVISGTTNEQAAREFVAFIAGPPGHKVLEKYGFKFPNK